MHSGRRYKLKELLFWTRRDIYALLVLAVVPTAIYQLAGWHWIAIPWQLVAVLGTAAAFIVGFRIVLLMVVHGKQGRYGERL